MTTDQDSNSENQKKIEEWKGVHQSELEFYDKISKQMGFSRDFRYSLSPLHQVWHHKIRRFGSVAFEGKSVLEVGSNVFGPLHFLQASNAFKVGIDPLLRELYKEVAAKDINYVRSVGENLPFSRGKFDVVLCHNVLDHVIDAEKVVREVHRVLKERGLFLLCVNTFSHLVKPLNPIIKRIDIRHPYHFNPSEVQDMLNSHGFRIVRFATIMGHDTLGAPEQSGYRYLVEWLKARRFKSFVASFIGRTIYATARK